MGISEKWNPRPGSVGGTRDPIPGTLKVGPETWDLPHSWDRDPGSGTLQVGPETRDLESEFSEKF